MSAPGQTDADYTGKDVAGKVVLASGALATIVEQAVWKRGALGVVHFTMSRSDLRGPDPWERIPVENADKTKQGTFAFVLSQREGKRVCARSLRCRRRRTASARKWSRPSVSLPARPSWKP